MNICGFRGVRWNVLQIYRTTTWELLFIEKLPALVQLKSQAVVFNFCLSTVLTNDTQQVSVSGVGRLSVLMVC